MHILGGEWPDYFEIIVFFQKYHITFAHINAMFIII